jgi:hypothetical protein
VAAAVYELPVGKGKSLNIESRWANAAVGGWVVTGIYTFQTGAPINWTNGSTTTPGDYIYYGGNIDLNPRGVAGPTTPAFNTSVFDTVAATQLQYHIRTFSTTFPNLRQDGINNFGSEHAGDQCEFWNYQYAGESSSDDSNWSSVRVLNMASEVFAHPLSHSRVCITEPRAPV